MKLAIIYSENKLSGKLTKLFTGCHAYHVGWVDEKSDKFYDMHFNRRRQLWSVYSKNKTFTLHDFPKVKQQYLETQLDSDRNVYGVFDYFLFALRPLYHMFGYSTRNANGMICSEMVNIDAINSNIKTPWKITDAPPSPCDWVKWLIKETN